MTLDEMRCMETSAYIPREMFTMYQVTESEQNIFKVNLKTLTDILNIFGDDSHPNLKLTFKSRGSPLRLV